MRSILFLCVICTLIYGCTTLRKPYTGKVKKQYVVDCYGSAPTWDRCIDGMAFGSEVCESEYGLYPRYAFFRTMAKSCGECEDYDE